MNRADTSKGKILIADDSPTVVNILQAILEEEEYEVIIANDGIGAINKAYQEHPDLVVLDIFMPKINGYQVCRLLKNDEITAHIPVIMLTGSESGDKFWSLETGADEFRTKDFEFDGLIEAIEKLLSNTKAIPRSHMEVGKSVESSELDDEVQIMSKLSHLLDRELYNSTIEKIRLETILDNLGEGVFTVDADKKTTAFNKSLQTMTGLHWEQVLGQKCTDVIGIPLCGENCLFDKAMENVGSANGDIKDQSLSASFLTPIKVETELEGKDNGKIPVDLYLALLRDHVGEIVGAVCVCQDITRRKEIESMNDELSKAYKDLQDAEAQLIQSEKMASLGRLVAGTAHELNNPISFVYSNIFHLRSYISDIQTVLKKYHDVCTLAAASTPQPTAIANGITDIERLKEQLDFDYTMKDLDRLVDDIDEGAKRTKGIVEDLKVFANSDEGKSEYMDINEDIEKTLNLLVDYYKDRITIHRDYAELPKVKGYVGQINQVFMNLITNACQAMDNEGDIWITTRQKNGNVMISVRDNGKGIAKEHIGKIFDPFFTTKDVGKGAGLGLSISYGIIQRHRGEILVDSQSGVGATFTIRIPINFESQKSIV